MAELLKKAGFGILVVAITAGIYFFMFVDKATQQDALRYSLAMIGDRMFKLMPSGAEKNKLQLQYEDFIKQAEARQIPPGDIEKVAAQVLSVSYQDTIMEPDIKSLYVKLGLDTLKGRGTWLASPKPDESQSEKLPLPEKKLPPPVHDNKTWDSLNIRLNSVAEFDLKMRKMMDRDPRRRHGMHRQIHIIADSGIKIIIDDSLRYKFRQDQFDNMSRDLHKLEKQRIIVWKKNYMRQMERQMIEMQEQLKHLQHTQKLEHLQKLQQLQELQQIPMFKFHHLEALKSLDSLKYLEVITSLKVTFPESLQVLLSDSINRIVEQNLEAAGILRVETRRPPPPPPPQPPPEN